MTLEEYMDLLDALNNLVQCGTINPEMAEQQIHEAWRMVVKNESNKE